MNRDGSRSCAGNLGCLWWRRGPRRPARRLPVCRLQVQPASLRGRWERILVHSGHGGVLICSHLTDTDVHTRWLEFYDRYANRRLATTSEAAGPVAPPQERWTP